jgi:hypothetical protein
VCGGVALGVITALLDAGGDAGLLHHHHLHIATLIFFRHPGAGRDPVTTFTLHIYVFPLYAMLRPE